MLKYLLLSAAIAFSATYQKGTGPSAPIKDWSAPNAVVVEVTLDTAETGYSQTIDFLKFPRLVYDTSIGLYGADTTYPNNWAGALKATCNLIADTVDSDDTVDVDVYVQFSEYFNVSNQKDGAFADSWTDGSDTVTVSGTAAQASGLAVREGTPSNVTLPSQYTRYGRITLENNKVYASNSKTKCRAYFEVWEVK